MRDFAFTLIHDTRLSGGGRIARALVGAPINPIGTPNTRGLTSAAPLCAVAKGKAK